MVEGGMKVVLLAEIVAYFAMIPPGPADFVVVLLVVRLVLECDCVKLLCPNQQRGGELLVRNWSQNDYLRHA